MRYLSEEDEQHVAEDFEGPPRYKTKMSNRILAVDPGTHESAVLFWTNEHVALPRIMPNQELRDWLADFDKEDYNETVLAVEMIASYGMSVGAEVFETCVFIGRLQEIWLSKGRPFHLIYRREVKMELCGTMKAKDANIRQRLIDLYGAPGTKKNPGKLFGIRSHLWAALGVAVTAEAKLKGKV